MLNTDKLRGLIAEKGSSQRKEADYLGLTAVTFCKKMNGKTRFYHDELERMAERLGFTDKEILETFYSRGAAS